MVDQPVEEQVELMEEVDYTTVLDNFEGPIDLLLHLITINKIPIKDVFVSQVTGQFLEYMRGLPYIDVNKVAGYLKIAATILKIKARSLVPDPIADAEADEELETEKESIIRALEEFRLIKAETEKLKQIEKVGFVYKESDRDVGTTRTVFNLDGLTKDGLVNALAELLKRRDDMIVEQNEVREIPKDAYTVEEKAAVILESLEEADEVSFDSLFSADYTKPEIITTFQALLELLKHQFLLVRQEDEFGVIRISRNPDAKEATFGQFDEYN